MRFRIDFYQFTVRGNRIQHTVEFTHGKRIFAIQFKIISLPYARIDSPCNPLLFGIEFEIIGRAVHRKVKCFIFIIRTSRHHFSACRALIERHYQIFFFVHHTGAARPFSHKDVFLFIYG